MTKFEILGVLVDNLVANARRIYWEPEGTPIVEISRYLETTHCM